MKDHYIATLIGGALGDAFGMPFEGWPRARIQQRLGYVTELLTPEFLTNTDGTIQYYDEFGKIKYFGAGQLQQGDYTDDTILSLALAEALVSKGFDLEEIAQRQLQEYEIRIQPDGTVSGGFGDTTKMAFQRLQEGFSPIESGVMGFGNAPPMKMAPLGLYMDAVQEYGLGLQYAELISRITHLDPRSIVGGVLQAQAVYMLLQNVSRKQFNDSLLEIVQQWERPLSPDNPLVQHGNLTSRIQWITQHQDATADQAHQQLGSNSLVHSSYPFALFMFQKYWDDPFKGLIETVNYGGDCDTTGAMYGALAGAKHGMIFPESWLQVLNGKERLIAAAEGLFQLKTARNRTS